MRIGYERGGYIDDVIINDDWQRYTYTFTAKNWGTSNFSFYNKGEVWNINDTLEIHSLELREGDSLNIKTENKPLNTEIGTILIPKRAGYIFDGWYTSPVGGEKITSKTKITGNTTYYAHWLYKNM